MTKEKSIDTNKQDNQPQEKFADELLSEAKLDNVAGGTRPREYSQGPKTLGGTSGKSR